MEAFLKDFLESSYRRTLALTSFPVSYHPIRRLVFAYHDPALQPALRSQLDVAHGATLRTHYELYLFMCENLDEKEQDVQGILRYENRTSNDELYKKAIQKEWQFAMDTIS
tara:strand:+ start:18278 stop:18610 length:333 start_codon:yes stop_codon:yes gene_type:complete